LWFFIICRFRVARHCTPSAPWQDADTFWEYRLVSHAIPRRRTFALWASALALVSTCGCSDRSGVGTTYPVSGKITLDGEPLNFETTVVLFTPDDSKGNLGQFSPAAGVDLEGRYSLKTNGKAGAPPGWYRVIVTAHDADVRHPKQGPAEGGARSQRPVARSIVPQKYGRKETTDVSIEVVAEPATGAYDLRLTSQ
jgi:hypothetical protein